MKAIFNRDINVRSKTRNVAWSIKATPYPQTFPRECIEIAVARGAAEIVPPKRSRKSASEGPEQKGKAPVEKGEQPTTSESQEIDNGHSNH